MSGFKNGDTGEWNAEKVRRQEQHSNQNKGNGRQPQQSGSPLLNMILYAMLVLLTSAVLASVGWKLASDLCAFNKGTKEDTVVVEVTETDTVSTVADKLEEAGLIEYKWFFKLFAKFANADEKIGMGIYTLNKEMDYRALIVGMRPGSPVSETVDVTIPEGYTVMQTIKLLAKNGVNTEKNLLEAAKTAQFDYDFIDNDSKDITRLEGYLFPDTYTFYVGHNPEAALGKFLKNFKNKYNSLDPELLAQAEANGYTMKDIVTIASLIEKETDGSDRKKIASVIYNRLNDTDGRHGTLAMLNIDASLLYVLPEGTTQITAADKELDSPYNLYKYAALPPSAIANPGLASLEAALEPENTRYYYYALGKDGRHHFSRTLQEHNNFLNSGNYAG